MVNTRSGPDERDYQILAALRAAPVPGHQLAERLGISRVALWKRIERLKAFAYRIEGSKAGYRLLEEDAVASWAFSDGDFVHYLSETGSTMDEAWRLAEAGAPSGTMVIAERQTAGRGRQDDSWRGEDGSLSLTLVLRSRLPGSHSACLALEGAQALLEWLEQTRGCRLDFHWPNQIMAGHRKVGGLLVELAGTLERPRYYLLGLGVHFRGAGKEYSGLADLTGQLPLRRDLATTFREHMTAWAANPDLSPNRWAARCPYLSKSVKIRTWQGQTLTTRVRGFDERGGLVTKSEGTFLPAEIETMHFNGDLP